MRLLVVAPIPAWPSNRLKRLVHGPKRYLVDAALIAAALRLDTQAVISDGNILGRLLNTFVVAQITPTRNGRGGDRAAVVSPAHRRGAP